MDQADFVHMVRMSEHASADDSRAYRRSVAAFAALGYAWVLGCMLLAVGALWWVVPQLLHGRFRWAMGWMLLAAGGLLWACARALWVRLDAPEGVEITAEQAPALFEALERIRKKVKGPAIHHVYVDGEFNASIHQLPRYGLFGGAVNQLTVGLPLAMALDKPRLLAVLAHEYGHLRGDHGRFAAWIYRTRLSWLRLHERFSDDAGPVAVATQAFLDWYFPRFAAKTFALARQDEYEADRIAARLLGAEVAAAALTEIEVKGAWLGDAFWAQHWRAAAAQPLPVGPYTAMRSLLALPPEPRFAQDALRQALQRISSVDDTHPVLRDRVEALTGGRPALPAWSQRSALSLLGPQVPQWPISTGCGARRTPAPGSGTTPGWAGCVSGPKPCSKASPATTRRRRSSWPACCGNWTPPPRCAPCTSRPCSAAKTMRAHCRGWWKACRATPGPSACSTLSDCGRPPRRIAGGRPARPWMNWRPRARAGTTMPKASSNGGSGCGWPMRPRSARGRN